MLGKASEVKTKRVQDYYDGPVGNRKFIDIDDAINVFLKGLPEGSVVLEIKYQTALNESDYDHHALIIYKEAIPNAQ